MSCCQCCSVGVCIIILLGLRHRSKCACTAAVVRQGGAPWAEAVLYTVHTWHAECDIELPEEEGSIRLVDGLGTPCDPLYTGTVEIFHAGEWGTICVSVGAQRVPIDLLAADTVCRQLGFPHGTIVSSLDPRADVIIDYGYNYPFDTDVAYLVESEVSSRVWLNELECFGVEEKVLDCILSPPQFVTSTVRNCPDSRSKYETYDYDGQNIRLEVACRQFAVEEAAESIVTPEAGALPHYCLR